MAVSYSGKLVHKFLILAATLSVALLVPIIPLMNDYQGQITTTRSERAGVAEHREMRVLLAEMQRHRGASSSLLSGKTEFRERMDKARSGIDAAITKSDAALSEQANAVGKIAAWDNFKTHWNTLASSLNGMKPAECLKAHTEVISLLLDAMEQVADQSGLVLDPELTSFYLMDVAVLQLPSVTERMGVGRATGTLILNEKELSQERRDAMVASVVEIKMRKHTITDDLDKVLAGDSTIRERIKAMFGETKLGLEQFINNVEVNILGAQKLTYDATRYFDETTQSIDASFKLYDESIAALDDVLAARENHIKTKRLWNLLVIVLAIAAGVILAAIILRKINRSVIHASDSLDQIAGGRLDVEIRPESNDEVGMLLFRLGEMQTQLRDQLEGERKMAEEVLRIKSALDGAAVGTTISDARGALIYLNDAAQALWRDMESGIKKNHPSFNASSMLGTNLSDYLDDPEMQRTYRAPLQTMRTFEVEIGGNNLHVIATTVRNAAGEYIGRTSQWTDRTAEVMVEREVAGIVEAAANGDFSRRFEIAGKAGFFLQLGNQTNRLLDNSERGLNEMVQVIAALAKGDLTRRMIGEFSGTFGKLKADVDTTIANLNKIISSVKEATDTINVAAKEIASGNSDLSSRTEEQASSLEETASSMEQLSSAVKQNDVNARQANELASAAQVVAEQGGDVVGQVVQTMGAISESSSKIADIIGVIDGIAFQTNILALNAAVEAARAGEHGRGFAVVATEVRNLAQRSAAAAKEIKGLITASTSTVQEGGRLVESAGKTMEEVVASIKRVARMVTDISTASREQSTGIEQVSKAVSQMDEVTQQNAALVEEAAAAAESLEEQASQLQHAVSVFRLANDGKVASLAAPTGRSTQTKQAPLGKARKIDGKSKPALLASLNDEWNEF